MSSRHASKPSLFVSNRFFRNPHRIPVANQLRHNPACATCRRWHGACPPSHDLFPKNWCAYGKTALSKRNQSTAFTMPFDMFGEQKVSAGYGKELVLLCERNLKTMSFQPHSFLELSEYLHRRRTFSHTIISSMSPCRQFCPPDQSFHFLQAYLPARP